MRTLQNPVLPEKSHNWAHICLMFLVFHHFVVPPALTGYSKIIDLQIHHFAFLHSYYDVITGKWGWPIKN